MRPRPVREPVTLEDIARELTRVGRSIVPLSDKIHHLAARLDIDEPERFHAEPTYLLELRTEEIKKTNLSAIMKYLMKVDAHLEGMDRHVGAIRAKMDQISNDSWSREDFKQHLDKDKK